MSFQTAPYLRQATSRAKSDVANKLVGMFLHDVSRRISSTIGLGVADSRYTQAVAATFGDGCCYCGRPLENDRAAVEHLDGMNRFRAGLHIPGNVVVSCKRCNNEKRRDDQLPQLRLASTGWESFLSHDSSGCAADCKTCAYWRDVFPIGPDKVKRLGDARSRILVFRSGYADAMRISQQAQPALHAELEAIYRECQVFATHRISKASEKVSACLGI
ncbi:MAG: hypothetical protein RLZZ265_2834 [Verrucomicrobiota bacterium]|jgi:hypothetical protein